MLTTIVFSVLSIAAFSATTNVVRHVVSAERLAEKERDREELRQRIAAMTPEEREAWRAQRKAALKAARIRAAGNGPKEVSRKKAKDGSIIITREDGSVTIHKFTETE